MFFSGDHRNSKRKVDLRGKSKEEDRSKLLETARLERERRHRQRVENKAATRIQAFSRAVLDVRRHKKEVLVAWTGAYGPFGQSATRNDLAVSQGYLRQLLYFTNVKNEDHRKMIAVACDLILNSLDCAGVVPVFCSQSSRAVNIIQAKRLLTACIDILLHTRHRICEESAQGVSFASRPEVRVMNALCSADSWGEDSHTTPSSNATTTSSSSSSSWDAFLSSTTSAVTAPTPSSSFSCTPLVSSAGFVDDESSGGGTVHTVPSPSSHSSMVWMDMLQHMCRSGLFSLGRLMLSSSSSSSSNTSSNTATDTNTTSLNTTFANLLDRHLSCGPSFELALAPQHRASTQLLATPLLWNITEFGGGRRLSELWVKLLRVLAETLAGPGVLLPDTGGVDGAAWVLGNVLEGASRGGMRGMGPGARPQALTFSRVVLALLGVLPPGCYIEGGKGDCQQEDEDDDDLEDDDEQDRYEEMMNLSMRTLSASGAGPPPRAPVRNPPSALLLQLAGLTDPAMLTQFLDQVLPLCSSPSCGSSSSGGSGESVVRSEAEEAVEACSLLLAALTHQTVALPPQPSTSTSTTGPGASSSAGVQGGSSTVQGGGSSSSLALSTLAFSAGLVPRLWPRLKAAYSPVEGRWDAPPPSFQALAVFCPVFSFLLLATDDDEFYSGSPLPPSELPPLVALLKTALTELLEAGLSPASTPNYRLLRFVRGWLARVLTQVHDRECRRPQGCSLMPSHAFHTAPHLWNQDSFAAQMRVPGSRAREVLRMAPSLVPFMVRVECLRELIRLDVEACDQVPASREQLQMDLQPVTVQRGQLLQDGMEGMAEMTSVQLRRRVRVQFRNELGMQEAGVDGGGLYKDFLTGLMQEAFNPLLGLFQVTNDQLLYPNPSSRAIFPDGDDLSYFQYLGRMIGKALYEGILVEAPFAGFFLSKLRGRANELNDLPSLDAELYKNLLFLKRYQGEVGDLGIYFAVEDSTLGVPVTVDLVPGGRELLVTSASVLRYIHLMAHHRLNQQIRSQSRAFLAGFQDIIQPEWVKMFNEQELQMLISGSREGMDVKDLYDNTEYYGYGPGTQVVQWFWEVLSEFDSSQQAAFLQFVTSCSRAPLLGFKHLHPKFCIHRSVGENNSEGGEVDRLPTAGTCFNLLKLPEYSSRETLREKLLYAIFSGAGFEYS